MLFNSYVFLFAFLPITVLGYHLLSRLLSRYAGIAWLLACSLLYYGWWDPRYLALLFFTIGVNFGLARALAAMASGSARRALLAAAIAIDLGTLGYYKYANFFVDTVSSLTGLPWTIENVVLPIGVSFFVFQQIAYLVDVSRSGRAERNLVRYGLFVAFFPQLIAGPIVHHSEMLPQFDAAERPQRSRDLAMGLSIFAIGLAKKVLLADTFSTYASPLFAAADGGATTTFLDGWTAAASYAFQIYFDFSGYSDMAIGAALTCGILLPFNFDSPYRAVNIIDFWRRWHMTLSRFLRDYLYFPLGGNRHGRARRYANLMITMLLGGLWHGAGWNFVFWGFLHGCYLVANHGWRAFGREPRHSAAGPWLGRAVTFCLVIVAWVPFRAETTAGAFSVWRGMFGAEGLSLQSLSPEFETLPLLALALALVWFLPSSQRLVGLDSPAPEAVDRAESGAPVRDMGDAWVDGLRWGPRPAWALFVVGLVIACVLRLSRPSEFIYYQF